MTAPVFSRADRIAGAILSPLCILAVVIARAWCEAQLRRERRALERARSLAVKPRELR